MVIMIERPGLPPLRIEEDLTGRTLGPYKGPVIPIPRPLPPKGPYDGPVIPIRPMPPYKGPVTPIRPMPPYKGPVIPITKPLPPKNAYMGPPVAKKPTIPSVPRYGDKDFFSPIEVVKRKPWGNR